ncbi:ATP-binding protein [Candidatus Poriferisodalis sp.]|uniref:ATP-binding protein n=1 Tax=Candidatus Poriferisodalis sp. TaxID=3101277 RepID=UPI003B015E99
MDQDALRSLLVEGETFTVEFKDGSINDSELVEAVACLANGSGGTLLVGVSNNGTVAGAPPRHGTRTDPRRVEALIASKTEPAVLAACTVEEVDLAQLLLVVVPAAANVVATSDGRYVRRAIDVHGRPQCLPMRPHEVVARSGSVGAQDYSRVVMPRLAVDDLSATEFERFRVLARTRGDETLLSLSDTELLKALNLTTSDGQLTVGALLLFGTSDVIAAHLPAYEAGFQELSGLEVRASESGPVPLFRAMIEITDRVQARNPTEEIEIGLLRVPLPRFADVTLRELIANALVHRDYTANGATIIEVTQDALVVSNPGGLPEGVTTSNLLTTPPRPRNPALADAFKRAGLVERTSRGINRAFASQLALGKPAPDYSRSTPNSVVARVRSGPADKELAGYIAQARRDGLQFSLEDLLTLHEVRIERRISTARAAELFQVDQHEARAILNRLADLGLLEARGAARGRSYHLSAALYNRLGEPAQYVRTRGFDGIQQEQMVLTFVTQHGTITRREASELCQVDSERASRLLRRLRDEGKLDMQGEKRSARYMKPALPVLTADEIDDR